MAPKRALSPSLLATISLIAALSLASCVPPPADDAAMQTASPSSAETATPAPSESPTATCANVLTDAAYGELAASGATEQEPGPVSALPSTFGGGSTLLCAWGPPDSDGGFSYAQTELTGEEWAEQEASLQADGFSPQDDPRGELFVAATNDLGYIPAVLYSEGVLHYTSDLPAFDMVESLQ